jgi:hypothetical protein
MKGVNLAPDTVRASDLAALLVNLEGAIIETAKGQNIPIAYELDEVLVSLVRVEHGNSEDLTLSVAGPISSAVSKMTRSVVDRTFNLLPISAQEYLHKMSVHAIHHKWSYEFHKSNGLLVYPAIISYEFPVPPPIHPDLTTGTTTVWGHLIKVGGDGEPKALIRLRNGKLLSVRITRDMVSEIQEQKLIYNDLGFRGIATWRLDDWFMESFKATSISEYRPQETSLTQTFKDLAEASEGRWESIDPINYVNNLRSE